MVNMQTSIHTCTIVTYMLYHLMTVAVSYMQFAITSGNTYKELGCRKKTSHVAMVYRYSSLMSIANSVAGVKIFPVKDSHTKSFAYLPAFKKKNCLKAKVFESGGGKCGQVKHACERNFKDAEMKLINDCPVVTNYWSTWTPCVFCQWSLMKWKAFKTKQKGHNMDRCSLHGYFLGQI